MKVAIVKEEPAAITKTTAISPGQVSSSGQGISTTKKRKAWRKVAIDSEHVHFLSWIAHKAAGTRTKSGLRFSFTKLKRQPWATLLKIEASTGMVEILSATLQTSPHAVLQLLPDAKPALES
ncbi:hypothetical protein A4X13_0g7483 [Tilletia indica]|uniref:Uncharacterized protein n=1 Tax=Tilletia indica TaxID=43049 RepID=A0A177T7S2_9BASI|nr:hypothetical protein A4X13_0g7483 [Tilletia indica]